MSYQRVLPRDAFNEANLLKCIGQISLLELDHMAPGFETELKETFKDDNSFYIRQDQNDGSIYCANFKIKYKGKQLPHYIPLNCKRKYPMQVWYEGDQQWLFNEDGTLSKKFK